MQAFEYAHPSTVAEAVALLSPEWGETEILAGGTDLLSLMKDNVVAPKRLVNIKGIRELKGIRWTNSGVRIGALVTLEELLEEKNFHNSEYRALVQAAQGVTSPQIRAMGTVCGDLLQRPRCWYYRAGYGLLARDAQGRALIPNGDNRYHAILGNSGPAYFVHPSSLAPALIAAGGWARMIGPSGERTIALEKFFIPPKTDADRESVLRPNEILTEVRIDLPQLAHSTATYEVRQREALDWPLAAASVSLGIIEGKVGDARIVMGHVAPVPWRSAAAEKLLSRKALTPETAAAAGDAAVQDATPLSGNGYKVQLARVAVKRALLAVNQSARHAAAGGGA